MTKFTYNANDINKNSVKVRENMDINLEHEKKENDELKKNLKINEHINNINLTNKIKLKHQNKKRNIVNLQKIKK